MAICDKYSLMVLKFYQFVSGMCHLVLGTGDDVGNVLDCIGKMPAVWGKFSMVLVMFQLFFGNMSYVSVSVFLYFKPTHITNAQL